MNELDTLLTAIRNLVDTDEESLTEEVMNTILSSFDQNFSPALVSQATNQIIKNLEDQGLNKAEAAEAMQTLTEHIRDLIYEDEEYTGNRKVLVDHIIERLSQVFNGAVEKFHSYSIELPIKLEKGAQVPTYAHDTDAAADLYAFEDIILKGPSLGNKVHTGVSIQLPEGWLALIIPRSSIGAKTPLRLSNSIGLIDSGYRGELGVLYDNIDVNDITIHKGDRIAQLLVMPSYRFMPKVVDILEDSDRGEGGFGSTGT